MIPKFKFLKRDRALSEEEGGRDSMLQIRELSMNAVIIKDEAFGLILK